MLLLQSNRCGFFANLNRHKCPIVLSYDIVHKSAKVCGLMKFYTNIRYVANATMFARVENQCRMGFDHVCYIFLN